jgi:hypothetical protein
MLYSRGGSYKILQFMIEISRGEIMGSQRVTGIIPLDKDRKTEIYLHVC